jgi:SAM-dependent methyltransferase
MDPTFELHRHRRSLFSTRAQAYEDGRPGYPQRLYELLTERCGLGPGCHVLEIGPGTGQATGALLDSGATVVGVELGSEMAALLRSKYVGRDLEVIVGPFEEVHLADTTFDLVAAATSFHWVPVDVGLQRCAASLRVGGFIALWWNFFGDPQRPDPFHEALQPLLRRYAPQLIDVPGAGNAAAGAHPYALDVEARTAEIEQTGLFGPVTYDVLAWQGVHSPREIRQMFASFSPWLAIDQSVREPLLDELEQLATHEFRGVVERPYLTPIYTAQRI